MATKQKSTNKPVEEVRIGSVKAAIWKNDTEGGPRFNVTFQRIYRDEEKGWRSTDSFGRDDLLLPAAERTSSQRETPIPHRGLRIRSTGNRPLATEGPNRSPGGLVMDEFTAISFADLLHFGGFDYAGRQHYAVVVDRLGSKVLSMEFDNNAEGWRKFLNAIQAFPKIAFTIETSCGADVERLLEAGLPVFPVNPKSAQRYRDRKSVAGCKSDELDAFCMADACERTARPGGSWFQWTR